MSECCECQKLKVFRNLIREQRRMEERILDLQEELDSLKQFIFEQGCGSGDY